MPVPSEKIALFIDGANLYATAKTLGFDIDYKRLLQEFQSRGYLLRAFYYTAVIEDQEYSSIRPLIDWLDYNGYTVVTKATKEFVDQTGRRKVKGNMDIELAVDAMEIAGHGRSHRAVFGRRRFPLAGRGGAAQRRARHGRLDHFDAAADGRRRAAPSGRSFRRYRRIAGQDRPRSVRARRPRERRPRARASIPRNSCSAGAPQRACRRRSADDDEFERLRTPAQLRATAESPAATVRSARASSRSATDRRATRARLVQRAGRLVRPPDARLLIVGLAPGLHGANRTGRPFTGDYAGDLLYATLIEFGFAAAYSTARPDDGLTLVDARITNAVHCVPPENKPTPAEIKTCRGFLTRRSPPCRTCAPIVALGRIAHDTTVPRWARKQSAAPFAHGGRARARPSHAVRQLSLLALQHEHRRADARDVSRGVRRRARLSRRRPNRLLGVAHRREDRIGYIP